MKEGVNAAEIFFSPESARGCRKSVRHDARHIDLCRIVFLSYSEDKNVSMMEQPPEKPRSEPLKAALSCLLTCKHQLDSSYKHSSSPATASSCNTGVYIIRRKEKSQG